MRTSTHMQLSPWSTKTFQLAIGAPVLWTNPSRRDFRTVRPEATGWISGEHGSSSSSDSATRRFRRHTRAWRSDCRERQPIDGGVHRGAIVKTAAPESEAPIGRVVRRALDA